VYTVNGAGLHSDTICSDGIYVEQLTSIVESDIDFRVFPNPVDDKLNLIFPYDMNCEIRILSSDGRLVMRTECGFADQVQLDVSTLQPGMYLIEVLSDTNVRKIFLKN
jgi:hypothetical protein